MTLGLAAAGPDHPVLAAVFGTACLAVGGAIFYWGAKQDIPWRERHYERTGTLPFPRTATPYAAVQLAGGFITLFGFLAMVSLDPTSLAVPFVLGGGVMIVGLVLARHGRKLMKLLKRDGVDTSVFSPVWRGIAAGYVMALMGFVVMVVGIWEGTGSL